MDFQEIETWISKAGMSGRLKWKAWKNTSGLTKRS
jgi:acyl-CoA-binding protein